MIPLAVPIAFAVFALLAWSYAARAAGVRGDVERREETPVPRAAPSPSREMARRHRAQASRGHRNGRTGRRAASAEKDRPETQSAQQAEQPPQDASETNAQRGI